MSALLICFARFLLLGLALALHGGAYAAGWEWPPGALEAQFAAAARSALENESELDQTLNGVLFDEQGSSLTPEKRAIGRRVLAPVLSHPNLPAYAAQTMGLLTRLGVQKSVFKTNLDVAVTMSMGTGPQVLPPAKRVELLRHQLAMVRTLPEERCVDYLLARLTLPQTVALERQYVSQLPDDMFESALMLYQEAALLLLDDKAVAIPEELTEAQVARATSLYRGALLGRLRAQLAEPVVRRYFEAGMDALSPSQACAVGIAINAAVLDVQEPYRSWLVMAKSRQP